MQIKKGSYETQQSISKYTNPAQKHISSQRYMFHLCALIFTFIFYITMNVIKNGPSE